MINEQVLQSLRENALPKDAPDILRMAESLAFAQVAQELTREALIQVVGIRKNISWVAAQALIEFHTSPN